MRDYWEITYGPADPDGKGRNDYLSFNAPDHDLSEVLADLAETFGDNYKMTDCGFFEDLDLTDLRFTPAEIWQLAEMANNQESPHAFFAWMAQQDLASLDLQGDLEDRFRHAYRGEFDSIADYGKDWAEDNNIDGSLWPFVDWEGFGRSLASDYTVVELSTGKIAVLYVNG